MSNINNVDMVDEPNGIKGIRSKASTNGNPPAKEEWSQERTLKSTDEDDGLERIIDTEVQATVNNDTDDGWDEATVKSGNTIGSQSLLVDID